MTYREPTVGRESLVAFVVATVALLSACPDASTGAPTTADADVAAPDAQVAGDVAADGDAPGDVAPPVSCQTSEDCAAAFPELVPCELAICAPDGFCALGNDKDYGRCEDGSACSIDDYCLAGACVAGSARTCVDGNPCTDDGCAPESGCIFAANTAVCDDGNTCTTDDHCADGQCLSTPTAACQCAVDADCAGLDDDDACNGTLACSGGNCVTDPNTVITCDTSQDTACRRNTCIPSSGSCELADLSAVACSDGNPCTIDDVCLSGSCVGEPVQCPCTIDADCADFDDDDLCNGTLSCQGGTCLVDASSVVVCSAGDCQVGLCNPASGSCANAPAANGTTCDDSDVCTEDDSCTGGSCNGTALVCDDGDACTVDTCGATGCTSTPVVCDDGDPCTTDACDAVTGCTSEALVCDDGDACTVDSCGATGCATTAVVCDDGDPCTTDTCDVVTGCEATANPSCDCVRYGFSSIDGYDVLQQGTFDVNGGQIVAIAFEYALFLADACSDLSSAWCHFPGNTWTIEWSDFTALTPGGFHVKAKSEYDTDFYFYREDWLGVPAVYLYKPVGSQNTTALDPDVTWTTIGPCQ